MKTFKDLEIGDTIYIFWRKHKVRMDSVDTILSEVKTAKVTYVEEYHSTIRLSYHTSTYGRTVLVPLDNCIAEGYGDEYIATGPEVFLPNNTNGPIGVKFDRFRFFNCSIPQQIYLDNRFSIDYDKRKMILKYMEYLYDEGIPFTQSDGCISHLKENEYSITFKAISSNEFIIKGFCLDDIYDNTDEAQKIIDYLNKRFSIYYYELIKGDLNHIVVSYKYSGNLKSSFDFVVNSIFYNVRDLKWKHRNRGFKL